MSSSVLCKNFLWTECSVQAEVLIM